MAAEYDFRENPGKEGEARFLHPRIVIKGTVTTEEMIKDITWESSLTSGDVIGVLRALENKLSYYISKGYNVELGNIGYFRAALKSRPVMNKNEIRSASVSFDGVNFQPKAVFSDSIGGELVRAKYGFRKSTVLTQGKKKEIIGNYLKEHPFITRKIYSELSGRLKSMANSDLKALVQEGYLERHGSKSSVVYTRVSGKRIVL